MNANEKSPPQRSPWREALLTLSSGLGHFFTYSGIFWLLGAIALERVNRLGANATFAVGNVNIPKWQGAGFTNLDVVITCSVAILATGAAFVIRYIQHRDKLLFLRSRGITDFDKDGKRDVFTDRFLDDL